MRLKFRDSEVVGIGLVAAAFGAIADDWLVFAAVVVLWLGFKLLVTGDGIPVLFLAFTFQWTQVSIGLFYAALFGRRVPGAVLSDYRPMVAIGLGCVLSIAVGVRLGISLVRQRSEVNLEERPVAVLSWPVLLGTYVAAVFFEGAMMRLSFEYISLRQIIVTLTVVRLGLLFLIMRRLCHPVFRWRAFAALLTVEVALGFTGFFAGFRDPLVLAVLALLEIFDRRRALHWISIGGVVGAMCLASVVWMGVRDTYRRDFQEIDTFSTNQSARMDRISDLSSAFFQSTDEEIVNTIDDLVDRIWAVYYPALAIARVPSALPHTGGAILEAAVRHVVTPRVFFPDKAELPSDSEMVRKYSGIYVAGREENTSIAFGYAAESYIDFGVPLMFLPIVGFGLLMGVAYAWFIRTIWHRELAVALVTVIFWLGLYLFERSWANTLGYAASLFVYLGIPAVLLDRYLLIKFLAAKERQNFVLHDFAESHGQR